MVIKGELDNLSKEMRHLLRGLLSFDPCKYSTVQELFRLHCLDGNQRLQTVILTIALFFVFALFPIGARPKFRQVVHDRAMNPRHQLTGTKRSDNKQGQDGSSKSKRRKNKKQAAATAGAAPANPSPTSTGESLATSTSSASAANQA